ncbi:MAG: tRNA pseudouridine(54/55) synthase Pus10 [archaeon]
MRESFGSSDESLFAALEALVSKIEFSTFFVGVTSADPEKKPELREKVSGFLVRKFSAALGSAEIHDLYVLADFEKHFAEATPSNVFVEGFYNKYERGIAQTFHYCFKCKGRGCAFCSFSGKLSKDSVQELLEKFFLPAFESKESRFHGCGREDADVLMLGNGRPFVIEVVSPKKRSAELKLLESEINSAFEGRIAVHGLGFCGKDKIVFFKSAVFEKIYCAHCESASPIPKEKILGLAGKKFDVLQFTPERVEKRRALMERKKYAEIKQVSAVAAHRFDLVVLASHGMYVKEFVSGDNGRTKPSISSLLGAECICAALDVLEIII